MLFSQNSQAYSVLTHEQVVDLLWKSQIRPMLLARFPNATDDQIKEAHAYAYGGCLIQDIGYYPFGNHLFSDLTHYVRSGDFVMNLLNDAKQANDMNQYAFALGALAHYVSDTVGHPAVNLADATYFPKLRAKFGPVVTYADSPTDHVRTEFGFDVAQVAQDRFTSQAFHDFIGFEVSKPLMEQAFVQTYGLPLDSIFPDLDLAIGTFRYSVSRLLPELTRVAIAQKKDEILKGDPTMTKKRFVYNLKRSEYRKDFGRKYKAPSIGDRILAFFISILPKIGPLRSLDVKVPTPYTENLYMKSVNDTAREYGEHLTAVSKNSLTLPNMDFDTGNPSRGGEYSLADTTYADLLEKLSDEHFANVGPSLQANILSFYRDAPVPAYATKNPQKWAKTQSILSQLQTLPPTAQPTSPAL